MTFIFEILPQTQHGNYVIVTYLLLISILRQAVVYVASFTRVRCRAESYKTVSFVYIYQIICVCYFSFGWPMACLWGHLGWCKSDTGGRKTHCLSTPFPTKYALVQNECPSWVWVKMVFFDRKKGMKLHGFGISILQEGNVGVKRLWNGPNQAPSENNSGSYPEAQI